MADPFLSEIKIVAFSYAPRYWAFCNGQTIAINQNQALFSLLGTAFGGDGITTFKLPNMQGNVPIHPASGHVRGEIGGEPYHALSPAELPKHTHTANATTVAATLAAPGGNLLGGAAAATPLYSTASNLTTMSPTQIDFAGGSQPHTNMQPYLAVNFCIALSGIFPSRT